MAAPLPEDAVEGGYLVERKVHIDRLGEYEFLVSNYALVRFGAGWRWAAGSQFVYRPTRQALHCYVDVGCVAAESGWVWDHPCFEEGVESAAAWTVAIATIAMSGTGSMATAGAAGAPAVMLSVGAIGVAGGEYKDLVDCMKRHTGT